MNELEFYNQQYIKYQKYDRQRGGETLNLKKAEDYFESLVRTHSNINGKLVDLGCGDGYFTSKFVSMNHTVIGIESSFLIKAANDMLENGVFNNLEFLKEDANQLSLDTNSVDLVISRRGPDPEKEIFRILKQNGMFIFITIGEKDALSLKRIVGRGQHYESMNKVSDVLKVKFNQTGFSSVITKDFHYDNTYHSSDEFREFLHQVPIINDFSELDYPSIDNYCGQFKETIQLNRHRVVLFAKKTV